MSVDANPGGPQDPAPLEKPTPRPTQRTRSGIWAFAIVGVIVILAIMTWLFTGLSFFDETPDEQPAAETARIDAPQAERVDQPMGIEPVANHA